ncbi:hypothetical protein Q2941_10165 [Bradyrhizobium sp. UFLA05-153]
MMWPLPLLFYALILEEIFPSRIAWDGHTAWKRCDSAIAGRTSWPGTPSTACEAMHLCANEAPLSGAQEKLLKQAIRATPGCKPP